MVLGFFCAAVLFGGCATKKAAPAPPPKAAVEKPVTTPDLRSVGLVAAVNAAARFAVINYPPGAVPKAGQHLGVYRNGLKVGEVTVTGPERDNNTVGDIVQGDIQVHDQTRQE
jgi:hypothetical protein